MNAEREINREYKLDLGIRAFNFGSTLSESDWGQVTGELSGSDVVFVIHVMDGENASRLIPTLERFRSRHCAVIVINCMPDLMRLTRLGSLDAERFSTPGKYDNKSKDGAPIANRGSLFEVQRGIRLLGTVGSWVGRQVRDGRPRDTHGGGKRDHGQYLKLIDKLPALLRLLPTAGVLRDVKHYLYLFCYFLQPTPTNIRLMILYALKNYVPNERLKELKLKIPAPQKTPAMGIYHPDASGIFTGFEAYEEWYLQRGRKLKAGLDTGQSTLDLSADRTIGLLLMRPQVVSHTRKHYDALIRAIEREGLSVIPALSTLMDNREACQKYFFDRAESNRETSPTKARVSQVVSLTGFSFVGGPAMNDSLAASDFLTALNRPYHSAVSLDAQTIESWLESRTGLNPIQAGMQVAIPEIDGATEPFVYGGIPANGVEPLPLEDRCVRFASRLRRWNRLRTADRGDLRLAFVLFCFPPNKGAIGTAADLDVFPSLWDTLTRLRSEGYKVDLPDSAEDLRQRLLSGNSERYGATVNVAYRMSVPEYERLCPYVEEIEIDWGRAPGQIGTFAGELLIQGVPLDNVFIGIQPTFGYEGDPMKLMMARSGAPHHGFMAFYTFLTRVLDVDAVIHVGTHGALEFMPGKQVGLSQDCWPDRLIDELPNFYLYSVNNPSEGSIAKRRSYAELISYLTPPLETAGLYKDLASLKELIMAYRLSADSTEKERIYVSIQELSAHMDFDYQLVGGENARPLA